MPKPRTKREKEIYCAGYDQGKTDFFKKYEAEKLEKECLQRKLMQSGVAAHNLQLEAYTKLINAAGQSMQAIATAIDCASVKL